MCCEEAFYISNIPPGGIKIGHCSISESNDHQVLGSKPNRGAKDSQEGHFCFIIYNKLHLTLNIK